MTMSTPLTEDAHSFTRDHIHLLAQQHSFRSKQEGPISSWKVRSLRASKISSRLADFHYEIYPRGWHYLGHAEQKRISALLSKRYLRKASSLFKLDKAIFSGLVKFQIDVKRSKREVFDETCELLKRLPDVPLELHDSRFDLSYDRVPGIHFVDNSNRCWKGLKASRFIASAVLALALRYATDHGVAPADLECERIAYLLQETIILSEGKEKFSLDCFLLKTYLWSLLQRLKMLSEYIRLERDLKVGFNTRISRAPAEERYHSIQNHARRLITQCKLNSNDTTATRYMCMWAFELLNSNPRSTNLDLRHLTSQFRNKFENYPPRCLAIGDDLFQQCLGASPLQCNRFTGMKIEDQSAHSSLCISNLCGRLYWNEESYRTTEGGRAVSITRHEDGLLLYCTSSARTIAISHVWSHGQGGRPEHGETGLNRCLHERYCRLAERHGCDSYWMDTPCIPSDHELRREAISRINQVFETSRLTVVCDRDLMEIDLREPSIDTYEQVLATVLLSDWNVRAWTLLEGTRGRRNLHLLCKDDKLIPLQEVVEQVHRHGRIDLSILSSTAQHLLQTYKELVENVSKPREGLSGVIAAQDYRTVVAGIVDPYEAAALLSHRHASREGDNIVIWSLLCSRTPYYTAKDLWLNEILGHSPERLVPTGFLVSSIPRLKGEKGLGWAPSRPDLPPESQTNKGAKRFPAYSGFDSLPAKFTDDGLRGVWFQCLIKGPNPRASSSLMQHFSSILPAKSPIRSTISSYLENFTWGALLRPSTNFLSLTRLDDKEHKDHEPFPYQGNADGPLVVVVGSNDDERQDRLRWEWIDVVEWAEPIPLPTFKPESVLLI
ncbi:MAG: hypothetical protein Q9160_000185 [Pyrenula sp. 1 TL-2023]